MANTQIDISTNGTTTLITAGKYCDRNIDVNVNVPNEAVPTSFTNVLTHPSTTVVLNKNSAASSSEMDYNGDIIVYIDLVGLGFNTHPAELTFRWRGMDMSAYTAIYLSTDKTTWSAQEHLYNSTLDECGDHSLYRKINYPTSNRYLKVNFCVKGNKIAVTQEDVNKCILTINEPIGNTVDGIIPNGTTTITSNGTYDVSEFAAAEVNVTSGGITPTGTKNITENGTHDVAEYANVNVNVQSEALPTPFTNVLKHESTTVTLNTVAYVGGNTTASNGNIMVDIDLVGLGITAHPAELTFRWRGMGAVKGFLNVYLSSDKTTWSAQTTTNNATIDEHGDLALERKINYPSSNRYLRLFFAVKYNADVLTEADIDKCILTINEPIGNGGYVG